MGISRKGKPRAQSQVSEKVGKDGATGFLVAVLKMGGPCGGAQCASSQRTVSSSAYELALRGSTGAHGQASPRGLPRACMHGSALVPRGSMWALVDAEILARVVGVLGGRGAGGGIPTLTCPGLYPRSCCNTGDLLCAGGT